MSFGRQDEKEGSATGTESDPEAGFEEAGVDNPEVDQRLDDVTGTDSRENWNNG